jgi:hypothetical protein
MQVTCRSLPKPSQSHKREENAEVLARAKPARTLPSNPLLISVYSERRKKKAICAKIAATGKDRLIALESRGECEREFVQIFTKPCRLKVCSLYCYLAAAWAAAAGRPGAALNAMISAPSATFQTRTSPS